MKAQRTIWRIVGAATAAGAVAWLAIGASGTESGAASSGSVSSVADESPGYAVEKYNYPLADKILAEKNIILKRGDGHITLADCVTDTGQLEVWAHGNADKICFDVKGTSGWLTLEIPAVYGIRGNDYETQVDMTVGTEEKSFDVAKNTWTAVGSSADEQGRDHILVEIRSSK
ncbi:hypothetical protein PV682_35080 [Streptomyces niveiscabiei]|uniref:hypothetical protein n=1 Tax=Streptomyces niveiscabiei TaxID=164115 RepID=UPI0029BC0415|nr:hypothetical protein [Streptomyces niveiscabiei]MDX3386632.1 hypothetical protein [Streptomyces niveiscabiei]